MEAEPLISELLKKHENEITPLLSTIRGLELDSGGTCIVDEIYILRFILEDAGQAESRLIKNLEWRMKNRDMLLRAAEGRLPHEEIMAKYVRRGVCGWLSNQYLVYVVRAGLGDPAAIMRNMTSQQCIENMLLTNEVIFRLLDAQSRRIGRLCRVIFIIDLQGFSIGRFDRRFAKANGDTSHLNALYYPYLMKMVVIVNLPSTFRILYSFAKLFSSKSTLEKQKICPGRTLKDSASRCPFLAKFGPEAVAAIPHFLGGTHPVTADLRLNDEMEVE
jgi:hypothetical protein